jgi:hypothetical protein
MVGRGAWKPHSLHPLEAIKNTRRNQQEAWWAAEPCASRSKHAGGSVGNRPHHVSFHSARCTFVRDSTPWSQVKDFVNTCCGRVWPMPAGTALFVMSGL